MRSMGWLTHNWQRRDEGIWEGRGRRQEFLLSRLMCWVAFDRAIRLARKRGLPAPLVGLLRTSGAILQDLHNGFLDSKQGSYGQHKGNRAFNGSRLLMPLNGSIMPHDPP